ncbi:CMGC family protein kinase [Tritrichomonas foetus]|uniref:CMGC family protein kinase n=1 Tax=Tritrichomonas foetus TaxID=1144522 RepID=A0A1J4KFR2_9EUKA|nr:CMGC family protein kinase [Tritrichomonas foetus]|eukprot:OHT08189.1 CMGC family protein kinase [Tritrichomonas foetus]
MRRFEELEVVGDGAFGVVTKCRDKETGELVAIKKIKKRFNSFDECLQLKEVKSLRKIKHQNVIKLLQVFRENEFLYLVFELMGRSLLKTINEVGGYKDDEVRSMMKQILTGLAYVHRQGFFHRDMKPDNVLWKDNDYKVLKIGDFGLAREIRSRPPYTEYVSTRWYRAPEIILRSENYNSPVDIWATAVIMAELYTARPLFQGNSESDQLYKIFAILGTPNSKTWPDGIRLATKTGFRFSNTVGSGLAAAVPNASRDALDLMTEMLRFDPARRPSAAQALQHRFFKDDDDEKKNNNINSDNIKNVNLSNSFNISNNSSMNIYSNSNSNYNSNLNSNNNSGDEDNGESIITTSSRPNKNDMKLDDILSTFVKKDSDMTNTYSGRNESASTNTSGRQGYSYSSLAPSANYSNSPQSNINRAMNMSALAKEPNLVTEFDSDELFGKY